METEKITLDELLKTKMKEVNLDIEDKNISSYVDRFEECGEYIYGFKLFLKDNSGNLIGTAIIIDQYLIEFKIDENEYYEWRDRFFNGIRHLIKYIPIVHENESEKAFYRSKGYRIGEFSKTYNYTILKR